MRVERGVEHIQELIPFMNKVFKKNFPKLLPKLYTSDKYSANHYYVKDGDKVVGTVASIPNTLKVYDKSLNARGIGMVACHKKYRGQGIMSSMLKVAIKDAKTEGVDFMYLSGNRQRYEHFGFVPAGYRHTFTLLPVNMSHMKEDINYTFKKVKDDSPEIDELIKIYSSKDVRYERSELIKTIKSWNIKTIFSIYNADGNIIGYLATMWGKIVELVTNEPQNSAYIVRAFVKSTNKIVGKIDIYPSDSDSILSLSKYAQYCTIEEPAFFKILNYKNVVSTLLYMQSKRSKLPNISINIDIENIEKFSIEVRDNIVTAGDYIENAKTFVLTEKEATLWLFAPTLSTYNGLPFDLPLFVTLCDNV